VIRPCVVTDITLTVCLWWDPVLLQTLFSLSVCDETLCCYRRYSHCLFVMRPCVVTDVILTVCLWWDPVLLQKLFSLSVMRPCVVTDVILTVCDETLCCYRRYSHRLFVMRPCVVTDVTLTVCLWWGGPVLLQTLFSLPCVVTDVTLSVCLWWDPVWLQKLFSLSVCDETLCYYRSYSHFLFVMRPCVVTEVNLTVCLWWGPVLLQKLVLAICLWRFSNMTEEFSKDKTETRNRRQEVKDFTLK
jgi:hypothetical protein